MKINRLSLYSLGKAPGKEILNFDQYSKFKYGHKPTALMYADMMGDMFLRTFGMGRLIRSIDDIVVSTSPFWYTPPPANTIALRFLYLMNDLLVDRGRGPLKYVKIHRSAAPVCDFSTLTLKQRQRNMKKDSLSVDPSAFEGKHVILIEDARITGTHEKKTVAYMQKIGVKELTFLYVIDVPSGASDPDIENRMNHQWTNSLDRVYSLMKNEKEYVLNARVCRYILSRPDRKELTAFVRKLSGNMLSEIYKYSVADGYGLSEKYRAGFNIFRAEMHARKISKDLELMPVKSSFIKLADEKSKGKVRPLRAQ